MFRIGIQSRVVCVLHFYIFGLYDLECIFMAIGLGYRHQHRGNFVYRKFGGKKSDSPTTTITKKKNKKFLYFCLCLSLWWCFIIVACTLFVAKCETNDVNYTLWETCTVSISCCAFLFSYYNLKRIEFDTTYWYPYSLT